MKSAVSTNQAPAAIGPYSQGIKANGLVWVSGQTPIDPQSGQVVAGGIEEQTRRVLDNVQAVLEAAGSELGAGRQNDDFSQGYERFPNGQRYLCPVFLGGTLPARATVEVARLPRDCRVEIEAVASGGRVSGRATCMRRLLA